MKKEFHHSNREALYNSLPVGSCVLMFSGEDVVKTNDEPYDFFAERSFVYLTGIDKKNAVLMAIKTNEGSVKETLYILPKDAYLERWTGRRLTPQEANEISGIADIRMVDDFKNDFHRAAYSGDFDKVYLDLFKVDLMDRNRPGHDMRDSIHTNYPHLSIEDSSTKLKALRLYKKPCEIEALRMAEVITGEGILAMMKGSKPGLYEYQYKAMFDYTLSQHGARMTGFPPIISAGDNNFCIHYYDYSGIARDGDMILNDVGVNYDGMISDVSRGFPCNGRFNDKQKLLYNCALSTSDYMFSIIKPGMEMASVDRTIKEYNASLLKDAGIINNVDEVGKVMWHGGAHHIGYDVHDVVGNPKIIEPNMVFCVDVGIYYEDWGIGFRLEDNCLVTEDGCENLSRNIPRTINDIENVMK